MPSTAKTVLKWLLRILLFLGGAFLVLWGVVYFAFWGCHDSGGFCAGKEVPSLLHQAIVLYIAGNLLIAFAVTRNWKKMLIVPLVVALVIYVSLYVISAVWGQ